MFKTETEEQEILISTSKANLRLFLRNFSILPRADSSWGLTEFITTEQLRMKTHKSISAWLLGYVEFY